MISPKKTDQTMLQTVSQKVAAKRSPISTLTGRKILAHQFHGDLIRFRPGGKARGIAGKHVHKQEHDHRDQKQCGQQPEEAFEKIVEHPLKPRRRAE